jgi:glycosyltransferase involved in cell wall biosynthesis
MSLVSVVTATYRRPEVLRVAARSVLRQTHQDWELLVIGDQCGPETAHTLEALSDRRIRYINLPARFGEQSGPNSIGLLVARGRRVAFLNHDDVWLPDHLERALAREEDFYFAKTAFASAVEDTPLGPRPIFNKLGPPRQDVWQAFDHSPYSFEPCSAWVVTAELAQRVGEWRSAATLYRTPMEDWLLRSARAGARFAFGEQVTVLKMEYNRAQGSWYEQSHAPHDYVDQRIDEHGLRAREVLLSVAAVTTVRSLQRRNRSPLGYALLNPLTRRIFRYTGVDTFSLVKRVLRRRRGDTLRTLLRSRTGEELPGRTSVESVWQELKRRGTVT